MVKRIMTIALVAGMSVAGLHAKKKTVEAQQVELIEAKQALEEVLFADEQVLKNMPTFDDLLAGDGVDLDLEGLEGFFNFDDDAELPTRSMWEMYRDLEFGEEEQELTMRQRMHLIGMMVGDFAQTVTTMVRFEINMMREQLSERLTTVWDFFSEQAYGQKEELEGLTAKEKTVVAVAITRSYANAFKDKVITTAGAASRSVGRSSVSGTTRAVAGLRNGAEVLRERGPVWAARAAAQTRKFAAKASEDAATASSYIAAQTRSAGSAIKRGSIIARNAAVAGFESARETLREELK